MATFTCCKSDPSDARDIGFELEAANFELARLFGARARIVNWSVDEEPSPWIRVELRNDADGPAAWDWYIEELNRRGIAISQTGVTAGPGRRSPGTTGNRSGRPRKTPV